jgi:hypothetical protein
MFRSRPGGGVAEMARRGVTYEDLPVARGIVKRPIMGVLENSRRFGEPGSTAIAFLENRPVHRMIANTLARAVYAGRTRSSSTLNKALHPWRTTTFKSRLGPQPS